MRRVSVANAKAGMTLGRAIYDTQGQMVLGEGEKLTGDNLAILARLGTSEILVKDRRVDDVPVGTLYPAHLEAKLVQGVHMLLVAQQGVAHGITQADLIVIQPSVHNMVRRLFPDILGDPDLCGLSSLEGYDYVHPVKVAQLAMLVGRTAGLTEKRVANLGMAAVLANIGYLSLPPGLLDKAGSLTDEERAYLQEHPRYSVNMLSESGLDQEVLDAIGQHHERWSGSGYPEGRKGKDICPLAGIIALSDTYHSLLSKRPFRKALRPHEAIEFIVAYSGDMFAPELVQVFARDVPQYPAGLTVRLNTGEIGIVSHPNTGHIARPIVRVCYESGEALREPYDLDLADAKCMNKLIVEVLL